MSKEKEIKELIRKIAGSDKELFFVAQVKSVEGETCTITYFDKEYDEVAISAISDGEDKNLLVTPAAGSCVIVLDLSNGEKRNLAIIGVSLTDTIQINGGNLGGIIKIQELTDKLNDLVDWCKNHKHGGVIIEVTGQATGTPGESSTPVNTPDSFNKSDYEDEKIKH